MEITFDYETVGGFKQKHKDFRNLFVGWIDSNNYVRQNDSFRVDENDLSIAHNWKYDTKCRLRDDPNTELGRAYDTQIAFKLLREDLPKESYKLENLAGVFYEYPNYKKFVDFDDKENPYWDDSERDILKLYNKHDVLATRLLKEISEPALKKHGMTALFTMVMDFIKELAFAEMEGIQVDLDQLSTQEKILLEKGEAVSQYFQTVADINWNSPKQVADYFVEQGFKLKKNKNGYTIDKAALKLLALESKVAENLLEWRKLRKQITTYTEGFRNQLIDGKYYPDYNLLGAVTGRLSEHFIQVMPKISVSPFKKCIVSKFEGGELLEADWSQLELKLVAEDCGDLSLISYLNSGGDCHKDTLLQYPHLEERTKAKNANFRCVYGPNVSFKRDRLVMQYGFTAEQAAYFINDFLTKYPGIKDGKFKKKWSMTTNGYVVSPLTGRRRYTDSEFQGYNAPIQGLGSDMNKIMFIAISKRLRKEGFQSHLIAEIHDSLITDCHPKERDEVIRIEQEEYNKFPEYFYQYFGKDLKLNYTADMKIGKNLFDTNKITNNITKEK